MAYALEFLKRLESINVSEELSTIAREHTLMLADANRSQLIDGRDRNGDYLPRYDADPYFKTIAQARGYEAYKSKISPSRTKPRGVRDYFINGYTHRQIIATVTGDQITTQVKVGWDANLENAKALGINPQSARDIWRFSFHPLLCEVISIKTGIPFNKPPYAMK